MPENLDPSVSDISSNELKRIREAQGLKVIFLRVLLDDDPAEVTINQGSQPEENPVETAILLSRSPRYTIKRIPKE